MNVWKVLGVVLVACSMGAAARAGGGTRADLHPWGRWKPGSWVETEIVPLASGKMLARETLVDVGDEGVRLHKKTRMSGPEGPVEVETGMFLGYAFMGRAHLDPGAQQVGSETRVALGRRYTCAVWRAAGRVDREVSEERTWITPELEYPVRIVTQMKGFEMALDLVRVNESFQVAGNRIPCARYEGTLKAGESESTVYQLRSSAVPGGLLRTELRSTLEDGSIGVHSNTVVAFEGR